MNEREIIIKYLKTKAKESKKHHSPYKYVFNGNEFTYDELIKALENKESGKRILEIIKTETRQNWWNHLNKEVGLKGDLAEIMDLAIEEFLGELEKRMERPYEKTPMFGGHIKTYGDFIQFLKREEAVPYLYSSTLLNHRVGQ